MSQTNDGGPAFPCTDAKGFVSDGMSLRDYFAGQALAGMQIWADYSKGHCNAALVERAYVIADAMLAERQKERE